MIDNLNKRMINILDNTRIRLYKNINSYILTNPSLLYKFKEQNLVNLISKLEVLNPMNTIKRGYAIVKQNDKVVVDVKKLKIDDIINIDIKNAVIDAKIVKVDIDGK